MANNETTAVVESKATKSGSNGKGTAKTAKDIAKVAKKAKVKLTADDRERMKTMTAEERKYFEEHGHLRGLVRKNFKVPEERQFSSAAELKEKRGTPLRSAQARILYVLSKAKGPLTRQQITELTGIDNTYVGVWVGRIEPEKRKASEAKWGYTSLLTLSAAKWVDVELEGRTAACAEITATGRKLLEQWDKIQVEKDKPTMAEEMKERAKAKK